MNALVLFLMAQPTQYYGPYSTDTTGFRVLVHDQNYWPDVENHGIDLSPGFLTTIPIQRHKVFILIVSGQDEGSCKNPISEFMFN